MHKYSCCLVFVLTVTLARAQPSLVSFSLSLTPPELLTLIFNTALPDSSCDVSKLTLQNSSTLVVGGSYTPQEGSCRFIGGGLTVTLNTTLSSDDWAAIQANIYLAIDSASAYLSMQAGFLTDGSNVPISSSSALQVTLFSANINPPTVVEVLLDLNAGIMTLSLYEGSVYLVSAPLEFIDSTGNGGQVVLTNYSTPNNVDFFYQLQDFLLNAIKLASPPFNVSLPPNLFQDSSGSTSPSQTDLPVTIIPDMTPPTILAFTFNLNVGQLDLTFDEPVDLDSIILTDGMYLTDSFQGSEGAVNVSVLYFTSETLNTELSFAVSVSTLNSVKVDTTLCTIAANCFLGVTYSSFSDTSGNSVPSSISNIAAQSLVVDTTRPELVSYTVNLDSNSVALTFNEPIDAPSFDPSGLTLDIDPNDLITSGDSPIQHQSVSLGGGSGIVDVSEKATVVQILLGTSSFVDLQLLLILGNITCIMEDFTAQDSNGNMVLPISPTTSFPPSQIILDQTPPVLLEFIASLPESHQLTFVFSEAVELSTWNGSALILTLLTTEGSFDYTFADGSVVANGTSSVTFTIDSSEFVFSLLMEHYQNAYVSGLLAVTTRSSLIQDLFGNTLQPVTQPLLYNATISRESPRLLTMDFDRNTGTLHMEFSNVVVVTFSAWRIRFQDNHLNPTHTLTLASNGSFGLNDGVGTLISLTLTTEDLNSLKLNPFLATSTANTFVALAENFAHGLGSIPLLQQNATQIMLFIPDTQGPEVVGFDLDLDSDILSIEFSEPVTVDSFDETRILLLNSTTIPLSETARVSLTGTYPLARGNVTSLRALISIQDTIDIKRQPLCFSVQNCFVAFETLLVSDVSGNTFLASLMPVQVNSVSPDVTPPQLLSFPVFDLDFGIFTIIFTEPVNGSSTDYTEVQFHNAPLNANSSITLTEGFTSPDHIKIDFHLSREDLNQLKYNLDLCTNQDDCWIRLPSFFVTDIGMNPFIHSNYQSNVAASFHQPDIFIPDQTQPQLESVSIDLDQGIVALLFSEPIIEATFVPSDITLLQSPSSSLSLTLSPDSVYSLTSFGAQVVIQLTESDLNWLKAHKLYTTVADSYLSLITNLIDTNDNQFQDIPSGTAFQVTELIPDTTQPQLVSFDSFNMENNSFAISFNEPVNVSTLDVTRMILVSLASDTASAYTLTGATLVSAVDENLLNVAVTLSNPDRVQIKLMTSLATVRSNTYLILNDSAIRDTAGNANDLIPYAMAVQLASGGYTADSSPASLIEFGLDLDLPILSLTFNDVIDSSTIDPSALTLQNTASNPTSSLTLTSSSSPVNGDSDHISISLLPEDLLRLKRDLDIATSPSDTYISIDSDFAADVEGRQIIAIPPTSALPLTSSFTPDTTSPSLQLFSLDMDDGTLQLNFSEPVLPSSVDPSQLTLHGQRSGGGTSRTLGQSTPIITVSDTSLSVELRLLESDLNFIKDAPDLAIDTVTTYLSVTASLVTDVSGNFIIAVSDSDSIKATGFTIDTTPPELTGFVADLTPVVKIYLAFSETVRLNGHIQTTISIANAPVDPTVLIQLTESDMSIQTEFEQVEISLSPPVITRLLVDNIASSVDSLYLSLTQGVVEDTNRNPVVPADAYRVDLLYKSCFSNTYNNATLGECLECPSECGGSCTGPHTLVGSGGCDSCNVLLLDQQGNQLTCYDPTASTCPLGYFSTSLSSLTTSLPPTVTESTLLCQECEPLCSTCDGPTTEDCQTCSFAYFTNTTSTALVECVRSCDLSNGADCVTCHDQCSGCTGPSNRDCVACREDSISLDQDKLLCVPKCTGNTYLSQESGVYMCQQCDSECLGCTGSSNTECTKCLNVNLTANGSSVCLAACPTGYYSAGGVCLPCHKYCVECTGPSNKNCTECVDDEVEAEDGGKECVPSCSYGKEYDTSTKECVLTMEVFYLSIAGGCVGVVILLLLILLAAVCCCYRLKKKRDKKGVFFVSATFHTNGHELRSLRNR